MAATKTALLGKYRTPDGGPLTVAGAFPQVGNDLDNLDLLQIVDEGRGVLVYVDYEGTVHVPGGQTAFTPTVDTRIGQFQTKLASSAALADLFADAFKNPGLLDIFQIKNIGGNVHYYLDYTGTAYGS